MSCASTFIKVGAAAALLGASFTVAAIDAPVALQAGPTIRVGASPTGTVDPVVYDSFTTATGLTTTTGVPRTFMGGAFSAAGAGPQVDITSLTVYPASTAATAYTNVRVNVQLWDAIDPAVTPVFSAAAGSLISFDIGPLTTVANTFYPTVITLPAPIRLSSLANKGIAISVQVDTGTGLAVSDAMTSLLTYGSPVSVGTNPLTNGFFRNASGRTDYNFASTDARTFTGITDVGIGLILNGNATVPVSLQSFNVD